MHWADIQQAGGSFVVQADGTFRLKRGQLTADAVSRLRADRPQILAEWCWTRPDGGLPASLAWDAAVALHVLRIGVALMAVGSGSGLSPPAVAAIEAAQQAVDTAWQAADLAGLVRATQAWVRAVVQGETADPPLRWVQEG